MKRGQSSGARRRARSITLASVSALLVCAGAALLLARTPRAAAPRGAFRVAVVRKPGSHVYEKVIEEFRGGVRAEVRVLPAVSRGSTDLRSRLARYGPDLIFAVGQSAYDRVRSWRGPQILHALVFQDQQAGHVGVTSAPPPDVILRAFRAANPAIAVVGIVRPPAATAQHARADAVARRLGITLRHVEASSPAAAISMLRRMDARVEGIWLPVNMKILTPQVVQYALGLQSHRRVPLMGAVRRHALQGALFAVDYDPRDIGRAAARMTNRIIAGRAAGGGAPGKPRITVNRRAARSIGLSPRLLRAQGAEVVR